jgi:MoaA/NifB/PqqE/SkfB family radical SAM enzyme
MVEINKCCFSKSDNKKVCWILTRRCNLSCLHCCNLSSPGIPDPINGTDFIYDNIQWIKDNGINHVILSGGEPLLYQGIYDLIINLKGQGLRVSIVTNGVLINYDVSCKLRDSGVDSVTVSLDGAIKLTHEKIRGLDTYNKTLSGIRTLVSLNIPVTLNVFLHDEAVEEIQSIINLAKDLSISEITFELPVEIGRILNNLTLINGVTRNKQVILDYFLSRDKSLFEGVVVKLNNPLCHLDCPAGKTIFGIDEDGRKLACHNKRILLA